MEADKPTKRGQSPAEAMTVRLSVGWSEQERTLGAWRDGDDGTLESRVQQIAVECLVACEDYYRQQMRDRRDRQEAARLRRIEDLEQARIEAERLERERREQAERERIERLLGEADALRRAQAIRAYVAEVERLQADGASPVDAATFARWRHGRSRRPTGSIPSRAEPLSGGSGRRERDRKSIPKALSGAA